MTDIAGPTNEAQLRNAWSEFSSRLEQLGLDALAAAPKVATLLAAIITNPTGSNP